MAVRGAQVNEARTEPNQSAMLTQFDFPESERRPFDAAIGDRSIEPTPPEAYSMPSKVLVIIVGFNNAGDICACLAALARSWPQPLFDVFIVENGGKSGAEALANAFRARPTLLRERSAMPGLPWDAAFIRSFDLRRDYGEPLSVVHVVEMPQNLGYAGAINACLKPMLHAEAWHAIWILNPDTEPTPSALFELADYSIRSSKGMVGSKICALDSHDIPPNCGLKWQKFYGRTVAVLSEGQRDHPPANSNVLDAPSGASIYVTRALIERIGLMDDRYFLYFEDLEWGCRAKRLNELGVSIQSVVRHRGGTTLGSASKRADRSRLSVYLEFRNRILFVKSEHKSWVIWTAGLQVVYIAAFLASGSFNNMISAYRGLLAGLRGESGRPEQLLAEHIAV